MQKQPQRSAVVGCRQIEFEAVQLGEAFERQQFKVTDVLMLQDCGRRLWRWSSHTPAGTRGILLATTLNAGYGGLLAKYSFGNTFNVHRMVHRQQLHLIKIDDFFHRFHQPEAVVCPSFC